MMNELKLRQTVQKLCHSLFVRGFVVGGAANVSARLDDGTILVTPTGANFGRMTPEDLCKVDAEGKPLGEGKPSKELAFHLALYQERPEERAVVHLHSTYLTALACRQDLDHTNALPAFTPYYVMRVGSLPVVPYYRPGDPRIAVELTKLARTTNARAFLLASHGPVVMGRSFEEAVDNSEELEETAKLYHLLRSTDIRYLTPAEISSLRS